MRLIDEEEVEAQKLKTQKTKRLIIISIVLLLILCSAMTGLIVYRLNNPTQITTYIDGVKVQGFDKILDFSTDENGETQIYIPNGVQSGEIIEIPNKGYKNAKGERGSLIGKLEIVIPEKITSEEKEMFKKLKEISRFNPRSV